MMRRLYERGLGSEPSKSYLQGLGLALLSGGWLCSERPAPGLRAGIPLASRGHSWVSDVTR